MQKYVIELYTKYSFERKSDNDFKTGNNEGEHYEY